MAYPIAQVLLTNHLAHKSFHAICLWRIRKLRRRHIFSVLYRFARYSLRHALPLGLSAPSFLCRIPRRTWVHPAAGYSSLARGSGTLPALWTRPPWHTSHLLYSHLPASTPFSPLCALLDSPTLMSAPSNIPLVALSSPCPSCRRLTTSTPNSSPDSV